jgi:hypothetical protein
MIEIVKQGKVVSRSRNLRGIKTYARRSPVERVNVIGKDKCGALLYVQFEDGAECRAVFESFGVCSAWVKARRSWGLDFFRCSDSYHAFYFPFPRVSTARA